MANVRRTNPVLHMKRISFKEKEIIPISYPAISKRNKWFLCIYTGSNTHHFSDFTKIIKYSPPAPIFKPN